MEDRRLFLLNGPNLNMLGKRETDIYGTIGLQDIEQLVKGTAQKYNYDVHTFQSNHEGKLIDQLQQANGMYKGIIFNPGAYTHTSIALHDAIRAIKTPVIEVHLSNIYNRESFRQTSITAPACKAQITGLGTLGYQLAALAFINEE